MRTLMVMAIGLSVAGTALAQDCPDEDNDGFFAEYCGGEDCDDTDPDINPDADEVPNDGIDQDCDRVDFTEDCDQDGDGFDALVCGGTDCNDLDPDVNPDAEEIGGDGIDQNCDSMDVCEAARWAQGARSCTVAPMATMSWLPFVALLALRRRGGDAC